MTAVVQLQPFRLAQQFVKWLGGGLERKIFVEAAIQNQFGQANVRGEVDRIGLRNVLELALVYPVTGKYGRTVPWLDGAQDQSLEARAVVHQSYLTGVDVSSRFEIIQTPAHIDGQAHDAVAVFHRRF